MKILRIAGLGLLLVGAAAPAPAEDAFETKNREHGTYVDRYGDVPLGAVIRTDERYNRNGLFQGPRGWDYWNYLADPQPYQNPNLWPDKRPTYFLGQFVLPAGSELTIKGQFPHARYFKFNAYKFEHDTFVAIPSTSLPGAEIVPDPGSTNPYVVGADRSTENRNFTLHVLAQDPPPAGTAHPSNTSYVGTDEQMLMGGFRIYVSDEGYDGAGWGPADGPSLEGPPITLEGKLADGTVLSEADVVKQFGRPMGEAPPPYTVDQWYAMVDNKDNATCMTPATAPACEGSQFEVFRGMAYTVAGAFMPPEKRAEIKLATEMEGGGDPTTLYMVNYTSRAFGPLYVLRGKMPTFPDTYAGAKAMPDGEVQYWSVATAAAGPVGSLWDGVFDMMVPLDKDGFYTLVVSRPEDRPANATRENGITWIDWGPGEGIDDPRNRTDWGMLLMRFMVPHEDWEYNPAKATKPGMEAKVMGPYYPRGYYTTKAQFEAEGPRK